jgi:hypothetical protein
MLEVSGELLKSLIGPYLLYFVLSSSCMCVLFMLFLLVFSPCFSFYFSCFLYVFPLVLYRVSSYHGLIFSLQDLQKKHNLYTNG